MKDIEIIPSGSVTSPRGFRAGATYAGIKKVAGGFDLGILYSETECTVAGVFTTNKVKAAPVLLSQERVDYGHVRALVANSGCANACTGRQGMTDAAEVTGRVAMKLGLPVESVLIASTGVIGQLLPLDKVMGGIEDIRLSADGGHDFEKAIMTTDTVPKEIAVKVGGFTIGGVAKGSGMIHPNLATLLSFMTTDAAVEAGFLKVALRRAVDVSFNMISVDDDTSTNDTVLIMANGQAGNEPIIAGSKLARTFEEALTQVCVHLAKAVARDGEGATKRIEVNVTGAASEGDARLAARTIVTSPLVKTAVHGNDPNWGRVVAAAGRSGAELVESKVNLQIGGVPLLKNGSPLPFVKADVARLLDREEVKIELDLGLGRGSATAWGCDLSEEYVKINAEYTT